MAQKEWVSWSNEQGEMLEKGETKESDTVVRYCNAMAEKESWSGWNQVNEQVGKINQSE